MPQEVWIQERVRDYYWQDDYNCATTTLKILAECFEVELADQVVAAAVGMHGAGKYGAQCGLVEGTLMFLGILGQARQIPPEVIIDQCRAFAAQFDHTFGSLSCSLLRPEGFRTENPPHLCESLTCRAVVLSQSWITQFLASQSCSRDLGTR